jgi:hypothetical protein
VLNEKAAVVTDLCSLRIGYTVVFFVPVLQAKPMAAAAAWRARQMPAAAVAPALKFSRLGSTERTLLRLQRKHDDPSEAGIIEK